jgi:voltage-gated potassium channel
MKQGIRTLYHRYQGLFRSIIYLLILLSVISFSLEILPDLSPQARYILSVLELVIVVVFSLEYLIRLYMAERKWAYVFSFYGMIDLLAIAPFYLSSVVSLQALRIIRLFRLLRVLKLARYHQAMHRIARAITFAREELIIFSIMSVVMLYIAAIGIYYFENPAQPEVFRSIFDCLWWAVATLTTVGYGDIYPITLGGKIFTFLVLMIGLGIVAVPAGILSSALSAVRQQDRDNATP